MHAVTEMITLSDDMLDGSTSDSIQNQTGDHFYYYDYEHKEHNDGLPNTVYTALLAFAWITNILGNICILLVFTRDKHLKSVQMNYIVNLAITDLLHGLLTLPLMTIWYGAYDGWPFGPVVCKFLWVVDFTVAAESAFTVVLISYDRFLMMSDGAQYNMTQTRRRILTRIAVTWCIAATLYTPAIIGYDYWRGYSTMYEGDCDVEFAEEPVYNVIMALVEFTTSFSLICTFNLMTFWKIRAHVIQNKTKSHPGRSAQDGNQSRSTRKAAQSLTMVVVVFMVCWVPYSIVNLINAFCPDCITLATFEIVDWVLWMHSSLNPVIYVLTNSIVRQSVRNMLCPFCTNKIGIFGEPSVQLQTVSLVSASGSRQRNPHCLHTVHM